MTACLVDLGTAAFAGHVFLFGSPEGQSVIRSVAPHLYVLGPSSATNYGRTDIWWGRIFPTIKLTGPLFENVFGATLPLVNPVSTNPSDDFSRRTIVMADEPAWAKPLLCAAVQRAILTHNSNWYFLLYGVGQHLMVLAVPRRSLSQTRQPTLRTATDIKALVQLTTNIAQAIHSDC